MLIRSALRKELGAIAGIVFATLFTIMLTTSLIRILGTASAGKIDTASVLPLIAFNAINFLPVLLVLTLYVAILSVFTRAYKDSEMVIWSASGQAMSDWIRPVMGFAVPFFLIVCGISFFLAPWANRQSSEYQQRFAQREDISQISAGQFREAAGSNRVFFVESLNPNGTEVSNVFVTQKQEQRTIVVASKSGQVEVDPKGERFLVLEKGRRYDADEKTGELRMMEFERYGLRLDPKPMRLDDQSAKIKTSMELVADPQPRHLAELLWRIGLPFSALVLALMAIPLAAVNPRMGRSVNLIGALLLYMIYSNMISLAQAYVAQEKLSFGVGVWLVHAVFIVFAMMLFYAKSSLRPWRLLAGRR
jgi:lipopolysaccharide export system permease protein